MTRGSVLTTPVFLCSLLTAFSSWAREVGPNPPDTVSSQTPSPSSAKAEATIEPSPPKKKHRHQAARQKQRVPFRAGAALFVGGTLPDAAPALGLALRGGLQRARFGFMLEGGLSGAIGGGLSSGDVHGSRATIFYHGYIAPMAELKLEPLFVSLGVPLGIGMWSVASNSVDALDAVKSETRATIGLVTFVAGLDARFGRHFGFGRHHVTIALGTKLLFAEEDAATTVIPQQGAIEGSHETRLGVRFVPMLSVGYDYF